MVIGFGIYAVSFVEGFFIQYKLSMGVFPYSFIFLVVSQAGWGGRGILSAGKEIGSGKQVFSR